MPAPIGGGWLGADLAADPGSWRMTLPPAVRDDLIELATRRAGREPALGDDAPKVCSATTEFVSRLRDKFMSGRYFVVVSGFPYEPFYLARDAYWLLGLLLGEPVSQTPQTNLVGYLEDRTGNAEKRRWRGYESANSLPFHTDPADLITMLSIRSAPVGGLSRLASTRAVHDLLAAEAPGHLAELYRPFPTDYRVVRNEAGQRQWTALPVFGFGPTGDFTTRYARWHMEASQRHADAPRLTSRQRKALNALDKILARPEVVLDVDLRPGDLQLFNNAEILHARSAFAEAPEGTGRLMLRLWLSFAGSPELPEEYRELFGATAGGSYRGGAWPPGGRPAWTGRPVAVR
ncbi:MAG TPA: TauD/TfdA family dioxygenase [Streptosporangiaceae bacterium]|nr:TauD/TfdA family dioxygenase [Streptosporangiaceae bacterium]